MAGNWDECCGPGGTPTLFHFRVDVTNTVGRVGTLTSTLFHSGIIAVGPVVHPLYSTDERCEELGWMLWDQWGLLPPLYSTYGRCEELGTTGSHEIFMALGTGHLVSSDHFFLVMDGDENPGHFLALDALEADPVFLAIDRTEQLWF